MPLWKLYYHIVWATVDRQPIITPTREAALYRYVKDKSHALESILHAVNGTDNHIHLIVSIPPKCAIANYVKHIKGGSSRHINRDLSSEGSVFAWQQEYAVFSMGQTQLDSAIAYVQHQKLHHAQGTLISALEPTPNFP